MHEAKLESTPSTTYGPFSVPGVIPECKGRCKPHSSTFHSSQKPLSTSWARGHLSPNVSEPTLGSLHASFPGVACSRMHVLLSEKAFNTHQTHVIEKQIGQIVHVHGEVPNPIFSHSQIDTISLLQSYFLLSF